MYSTIFGLILLILEMTNVETQFTGVLQSNIEGCKDDTVYFNWTFSTAVPLLLVEWKVNGSRIALENIGGGQSFTPVTSYSGRLAKISNAQISLGPVSQSDFGTYVCEITYNNGQSFQSSGITLSIYDTYNIPVKIEKTEEDENTILKPASPDSSITYTWSIEDQSAIGNIFHVKKSGNHTLCISGGKANCLNHSLSSCTSLEVTLQACTGAFECGFCPILIVVVSSVIICILMWKEVPKRIGGFSTVKIVIIVIFSVVAIGIGLGLGLGLQEGEENCLNCGATIGISISLGVALSVMQFAIIFKCNNEKGCKDSKGVTSDRSNGDRARTPTSASGVTMEAKKKSLNKPTEKGTEVSSLNTKPVGHPLPETPNGRKNQLEPIKTDSVEVDNSAREKKKKKKKKEKKEEKERKEEEKKENSEEEGQRPELQF